MYHIPSLFYIPLPVYMYFYLFYYYYFIPFTVVNLINYYIPSWFYYIPLPFYFYGYFTLFTAEIIKLNNKTNMKIINSTWYQKYPLKYERKFAQTKRVSYSTHLDVNEYEYLSSKFHLYFMDISDIELEFIIFIQVKIIIHVHVYNLCCKKYVVTVKK